MGNGPSGIAVGLGAVWVVLSVDGAVAKIDPDMAFLVIEARGHEPMMPLGFFHSPVFSTSAFVAFVGTFQVLEPSSRSASTSSRSEAIRRYGPASRSCPPPPS